MSFCDAKIFHNVCIILELKSKKKSGAELDDEDPISKTQEVRNCHGSCEEPLEGFGRRQIPSDLQQVEDELGEARRYWRWGGQRGDCGRR